MTQRNHNKKWTYDAVKSVALSCNTKSDFRKRFAGAEKWALRKGVYEEMCEHMKPQFRWTFETVEREAEKYDTRNEFHSGNPSAAQWAIRHNIMDYLFPHKFTFWCLSSVREKAKNYKTREEFRKHAPGAAQWAYRNGFWDDVCSHMKNAKAPVAMEEARDAAMACFTRSDFYYNYPRAYAWGLRERVLDDLCRHMPAGKTVSDKDCVYFWNPKGYPDVFKVGVTSQRLSDRRVSLVAREAGLDVDYAMFFRADNAPSIEQQILSIGKPYEFPHKFSGYTEFRHYSPEELNICFSILGRLEPATMEASS